MIIKNYRKVRDHRHYTEGDYTSDIITEELLMLFVT